MKITANYPQKAFQKFKNLIQKQSFLNAFKVYLIDSLVPAIIKS